MSVAHAGVNDRHDDVGRAVLNVPRGLRADIRAGRAPVKAGVVQVPKRSIAIMKVIGRLQRLHLIIRLGIFDQAAASISGDQIGDAHRRRHLYHLQIADARIAL